MAVKTFGKESKTPDELLADLHKEVGAKFPVSLTIDNGRIVGGTYETEWKEGSTEPVESKAGGIEYEENYKNKKLTAAQIKQVDAWLSENIAS